MGTLGNYDSVGDGAFEELDLADFVEEDDGIDHDSVTDDVENTFTEDSGGNGMEDVAFALDTD